MQVRLVVEADVEGFSDESVADFGEERVRMCVRQAVENALQAAHQDGFDHDLCGDVAIFIATVDLLKE